MALFSVLPALSAPGYLDASFDSDGKVITDFAGNDDRASGIHVQADGKIVVTGHADPGTGSDFAVVRYLQDGMIDSTFGSSGKATVDFGATIDLAFASALQQDEKIIVAGSSDSSFALARFLPGGTLDTTFGSGGKVSTSFGMGTGAQILGIALQSDGKIVAVGLFQENSGSDIDFAIARYSMDGMLDTTFGAGGKITLDVAGFNDTLSGVSVLGNGKILVAGQSAPSASGPDHYVARYLSNGTIDTTFGTAGSVSFDIVTDWDGASRLVSFPDGSFLTAGYTYEGTNMNEVDFVVVRYNADGSRDSAFGSGGIVITDFTHADDIGVDLVLDSDNKIIVAGTSYGGTSRENFALVRYLADGTPDTTFGNMGRATTDFGSNSIDSATAITLQKDGRILIAGRRMANFSSAADFAVARYEGTPIDYQPDTFVALSSVATTGIGDDIYNTSGAGQQLLRRSKRARTVYATFSAQNDGNVPDTIQLRGSRKNRYFGVTYTSGGNVTGAIILGTYQTGELSADERRTILARVKPSRRRLKTRVRRGTRRITKWKKKTFTIYLRASSMNSPIDQDAAILKVRHR